MGEAVKPASARPSVGAMARIRRSWQLYLVISVPLLYLIIFRYGPMYGAQIAFRDFYASKGVWGSPWVGFKHFLSFFRAYQFERVLKNTVGISLYQLAAGFPAPIILALAINNARRLYFKKTVQMVTYAPHFISTVVMVGIIVQFLSPRFGLVNKAIMFLGGQPVSFLSKPELFKSIYVWSGVWQQAGWGTIIYLAALAGIDPNLHEAAIVDGATRLQRTFQIDIPGILPTAVTLLILNTGRIMNVGFEKVFLMQNPLNLDSSEVIQTYVYKVGLAAAMPDFSYSAAVGLFNSLVNLLMIVIVNQISRRVSETSLW
jgi:ABC-type polysaccharide transport system permease subunit